MHVEFSFNEKVTFKDSKTPIWQLQTKNKHHVGNSPSHNYLFSCLLVYLQVILG